MANGRMSGFQLSWQTLIMSVGLVFILVGGFWTLAYLPIQESIRELKAQVNELRGLDARTMADVTNRFVSLREHEDYKSAIRDQVKRLSEDISAMRKEIETRHSEIATRSDIQQALNTTRVEFLSEIKRLDQANQGDMKRVEFEIWKSERDKTISIIQERQSRFAEALDSLYSKITLQPPSYPERR